MTWASNRAWKWQPPVEQPNDEAARNGAQKWCAGMPEVCEERDSAESSNPCLTHKENKAMKLKTLISVVAIATILGCQVEAQTYDTNNPVVEIFAGSGVASYLNGQGTQAMFNNPSAVVADSSS